MASQTFVISGSHRAWRGYPRNGRVRVWVGPGDRTPEAIDLYNPYSRLGRAWKAVVRHAAGGRVDWLTGVGADEERSSTFNEIADLIRALFPLQRSTISFFEG